MLPTENKVFIIIIIIFIIIIIIIFIWISDNVSTLVAECQTVWTLIRRRVLRRLIWVTLFAQAPLSEYMYLG